MSEGRDELIRRACEEFGLGGLEGLVASLLERDDNWRTCCGAGCFPCTLQLGAAVDRVRELIARPTEQAG